MHSLKHHIKLIFANLLFYSGIMSILCKARLKNKLVILMYHRVLSNSERNMTFSNPGIIVEENTFRKHVEYLTKYFSVTTIERVINHIETKSSLDGYQFLITFDDGWIDNYNNALPILRANKAPALIFLPVDYIATGKIFWQEQLANYLHQICLNENSVPEILKKYNLSNLPTIQGVERRNAIGEFTGKLKQLSNHNIDSVVEEFKQFIDGKNYPAVESVDKYINWEQVVEMANINISFGSHASSHRLLTSLSNEELQNELQHSKQVLESKLRTTIDAVAYPNGNYNESVTQAAKIAGYKAGFTTMPGYMQSGDNFLEIKRINIHETATQTISMFMCRILGIF